jgi:outer membrane immunogenic protein
MPWFGTARARLGWASDNVLLYATGGLAYGRATLHADYLNNGLVFGTVISQTLDVAAIKTGWTAGGGIEAALAGGWSAKFEYLYVDLGSLTGSFTTDFGLGFTTVNTVSVSVREHIARVGLNYRFGGPVVAGY